MNNYNILLKLFFIITLFTSSLFSTNIKDISLRLQWKHQFEFAGFYAAKELGYYKEAGINLDILEYDSNIDIFDEVVNEKVDFGIWGSGVIQKAMNGENIIFLANYFKRSPLAIITHPEVRFPSELKGKSLMIPRSDHDSANYHQMFKFFNMDINSMKLVPSSFNIQDFIDKKVDSYSSFLTNESYILQQTGTQYNVLDPSNYGVELYDVNLFTSKKNFKNNPSLVKKFIEASNKGWEYALKNQEEIVELILKKYNSQNKTKEHLLFEAKETQRMMLLQNYEIGSINLKKLERMGSMFTQMGMTKQFTDYKSIIYNTSKSQINLTKQELNYIKNHDSIPISVGKDFSPFSAEVDGNYFGFVNDLLNLLSEKTGIKFEKIADKWVDNIERFRKKESFVIADISYKKEREAFTLFTEPYYQIPTLIFTRNDFKNYQGLESLNGKKVGVQKGVFFEKELAKLKGVKLYTNEDVEEIALALSYGKIDVAIMNLLTMNNYIIKNGLLNIKTADELNLSTVAREDLRLGVNPDKPLLFSIIQKGLSSITPKEWNKIVNDWIGVNQENKNFKISLSKEEKDFINTHPVIKLASLKKQEPFIINNKFRVTGHDRELLDIISDLSGLKFDIQIKDWNDIQERIKKKQIDGITSLASLDTKNEKTISDAYLNFQALVITKKQDKTTIKQLQDLKGKTVALEENKIVYKSLIEKYLKDVNVIYYNNIDEILNSLISGKVDFTIHDESIFFLANKLGVSNLIETPFTLGDPYSVRFKIREDLPELASIINKSLQNIDESKKFQLKDKWFKKNSLENDFSSLSLKEKNYLKEKQLNICVSPQWMPFESINKHDEYEGIGSDFLKIFTQKLNKDISVVKTKSWDETLIKAKNNQCDILSLAKKTKQRSAYLNFTDALISIPYVIAAKKDKLFIDNFDEIKNEKFAVVKSYAVEEDLKQIYPNTKLIIVDNIQEALKKVEEGEVYGYIDATAVISYAINKYGFNNLKIISKLPINYELAYGIKKDDTILLNIFRKLVNEIKKDDIDRIYKKWIAIEQEKVIDYSLVWKIVLIALILLAIVSYWNRRLLIAKKQIEKVNILLNKAKLDIEKKNIELNQLAITDKLTSLNNRLKLDELLQNEIYRSERFNHTFGLCILDIDHFKKVNDTFGHQVGDEILIQFANILKESVRKTDIVGRWGGEEFLIIIPESKKNSISILIENVKSKIQKFNFHKIGNKTASFGVTLYKKGDDSTSIIKRADDALYEAKNKGRDSIVIKE